MILLRIRRSCASTVLLTNRVETGEESPRGGAFPLPGLWETDAGQGGWTGLSLQESHGH